MNYRKIVKEDMGLKVSWVAKKLGMPQSTFSMKLIGYRKFTENEIKELNKLLNIKDDEKNSETKRKNNIST